MNPLVDDIAGDEVWFPTVIGATPCDTLVNQLGLLPLLMNVARAGDTVVRGSTYISATVHATPMWDAMRFKHSSEWASQKLGDADVSMSPLELQMPTISLMGYLIHLRVFGY